MSVNIFYYRESHSENCFFIAVSCILIIDCNAYHQHPSPNSACTWGSNGVGKGPLKRSSTRSRCRSAFFLVIYSTWWHLPSKTHSKIDKLKERLHLASEVFNFLGSSLASGLAWTPGWPWPRVAKAEMGQGSILVKNWRNNESSQNGLACSGKS